MVNSLFAQSVSFGVVAGGGWNEHHRESRYDRLSPQGVNYFVGLNVHAQPKDRFSVRLGMRLSNRYVFDNDRFLYRRALYTSGAAYVTEFEVQNNMTIRDSFFEVPLSGMVRVFKGLHVFCGFQLSIVMTSNVTGNYTRYFPDGAIVESPADGWFSEPGVDEFAVIGGLNYAFPSGIGVDLKYYSATSYRYDSELPTNPAYDYSEFSRMIQLAISYRLKKNGKQ